MKKILLGADEIKKIELEILLEFKSFCEKNNLRYYLAYGTLLGAVRHKGFIPWDDDIDVCMPRPDYEKFIKIFNVSNERFKLKSNRLNNMSAPFTKVIDVSTEIEAKYVDGDVDTNLWIDVFPVDGLPENDSILCDYYQKVRFYRRVLGLIDCKLGEGSNNFRKYSKYILKPLANLLGSKRCIEEIEKLALKNGYQESKYVGMITWASNGLGERILKTDFEQSTEVEFEGHNFPAVACWDKYLTDIYGDYMQLPPVEKRRTHNMIAYKIED